MEITTGYLVLMFIGLILSLVAIYYIIYYAVKTATKEIRREAELTNQFLMTIMKKNGIEEEVIDADLYMVFPEQRDEEESLVES